MTTIVLFLLVVFAVPWGLLFLLGPLAAQGALWAGFAWILPTVWAPTIAALLLTRWEEGPGAVRQEIARRLRYAPGSGHLVLVAAVVPAAAMAVAIYTARAAGDSGPFIPPAAIPMMLVLQLLTGALGEELGWRGFLLPRLKEHFGRTTAAWGMATLWSLWHVAAFSFPGMPHELMPPIPALLSIVFFGVLLAFVFDRTGEAVVATIAAHLSLNLGSGFGGVQFSSGVFWWTLAATFGMLAILATIVTSRARPIHAESIL